MVVVVMGCVRMEPVIVIRTIKTMIVVWPIVIMIV